MALREEVTRTPIELGDVAPPATPAESSKKEYVAPKSHFLTGVPITVSMAGSSVFALSLPFGRVGPVISLVLLCSVGMLNAFSGVLIGRATSRHIEPFDTVVGRLIGKGAAYAANFASSGLLFAVVIALTIYLADLWGEVVFTHLVSDSDLARNLSVLTPVLIFTVLSAINKTALLFRVLSYAIVSLIAASAALVYYALVNATSSSYTCLGDSIRHPIDHLMANGGSEAIKNIGTLVSMLSGAFFIHSTFNPYFNSVYATPFDKGDHTESSAEDGNRLGTDDDDVETLNEKSVKLCADPNPIEVDKRTLELRKRTTLDVIAAFVLAIAIYGTTGLSGLVPNSCNIEGTPENMSSVLTGALGKISQCLFLLQCTFSSAVCLSVASNSTIERINWRRFTRSDTEAVASGIGEITGDDTAEGASEGDLEAMMQRARDAEQNKFVAPPEWLPILGRQIIILLSGFAAYKRASIILVMAIAGLISGVLFEYALPSIYWLRRWTLEKRLTLGKVMQVVPLLLTGTFMLLTSV